MGNTLEEVNLQLARKSLLSLGGNILIVFFGFISLIVIKRNLGYEAVGLLAFSLAYVNLFRPLSDLGFRTAHLKKSNEKELDEGICNGTLITVKLILTSLFVTFVLGSILVPKYLYGREFFSEEQEILIFLTLGMVFFEEIATIFKTIFLGKTSNAKSVIPRVFARFIMMALTVTVVYHGFSVTHILVVRIFSVLIMLVLFLYLFRNLSFQRTNRKYVKLYASFALPVLFVGFIAEFLQSTDKVMLQHFLGSEAVGIYVIPQRITQAIILISGSVAGLLLPVFSRLYSRNDTAGINLISNKAVKYISMTVLPLIIFSYVFAEPILVHLFGPDTINSVLTFKILLFAVFLGGVLSPYQVQIISTGHLKFSIIIGSIVLAANIILNLILIPDYIFGRSALGFGVEGAAFATLGSNILKTLLVIPVVKSITGVSVYSRLWIHFFGGSVSFLVVSNLYSFEALNKDYFIPLFFILTFLIYTFVLWLLNELKNEEVNFFKSNLNLYKMKRYIIGEFKEK